MGLQIGFEATKEDFGPYNRRTIINDSVSSSKAINLSEVNHKFDVLEDEINNFENSLSILNSKINQGINNQISHEEFSQLNNNYNTVVANLASFTIQLELLKNQIADVKNNDAVINNSLGLSNSKLSQLQIDLNKVINDCLNLKLVSDSFVVSINTNRQNIAAAFNDIATITTKVNVLETKVDSLSLSNALNSDNIFILKNKSIEVNTKLETIDTTLTTLNTQVTNISNLDIGQISSDIENINLVVNGLKDLDISVLTLDTQKNITDILNLKDVNITIQDNISSIISNHNLLKTSYELTKTLADNHTISIASLETKSNTITNDIVLLNTKLTTEIKKLEDSITLISSSTTQLTNTISNLNSDINLINNYIAFLRINIPVIQTDISNLKIKDLALETEISNLKITLNGIKGLDINAINAINTNITLLQTKVNSLETSAYTPRIDILIQSKDIINIVRLNNKISTIEYSDGYKEQYFYSPDKKITKVNYLLNDVTKAYTTFEYIIELNRKVLSKTTFNLMT